MSGLALQMSHNVSVILSNKNTPLKAKRKQIKMTTDREEKCVI